jgi:hypothetical protein
MNEPLSPSDLTKEQTTSEAPSLDQLRSELRQKKVDPSRLTHVIIPGDNLVGECVGWQNDEMKLKNPRRLIKQQGMVPGKGVIVSISMVDWDMIDEGVIFCRPLMRAHISDLNEETQARYFGIYLGYLEGKVIQKAREAGIEVADPSQVPRAAQAASILAGSDVRRTG